jgi:FkbM family methyltransferase
MVQTSLSADLTDVEEASEGTVAELNPSILRSSVDLIVRYHFDPKKVHDRDLAFFALADSLAGGETAVFLDIGANMGNTIASLVALKRRFTVHAFEINPALHPHLEYASTLYAGQCFVHRYGLSRDESKPWLYVPVLKDMFVLGEATLSLPFIQEAASKRRLRSYLPGEVLRVGRLQVQTRTLDSVQVSPDFIKIDVEGAEEHVIAGAAETLRRCKPLIMAENSYPQRVAAALRPFGYSAYRFDVSRGLLSPKAPHSQNTFYVEDMWRARLRDAGLLED